MDLNRVIKYLIDSREISTPPEGVELSSYQKMWQTATTHNWKECPTELRCNEVWQQMKNTWLLQDQKEQKKLQVKQIAYTKLAQTDYLVIRHRDQIALGTQTTLTQEQYNDILTQRQAIRDKSNDLESQINNAQTIDELNAIVWQ